MNNVIQFPNQWENRLKEAIATKDYEQAYDVINLIKAHESLNDAKKITEMFILEQLGSYLELKEVAIEYLEEDNGIQVDTLLFFIRSSIALRQYKLVMELTSQLIETHDDIQLKQELILLYEEAERHYQRKHLQVQIDFSEFTSLPKLEQCTKLAQIIELETNQYVPIIKDYLINYDFHSQVQTLMLSYLKICRVTDTIQFNKSGITVTVIPNEIDLLDQTRFATELKEVFLKQDISNNENLSILIDLFNMMLYPIEIIEQKADIESIIEALNYYVDEHFLLVEKERIIKGKGAEFLEMIKKIEQHDETME